MPTIIGPVTKKAHVVKHSGHNKNSLYERLPGTAGREKTMRDYGWTVERWWKLWNVERNPEPEDSTEGDKFLIERFGDFRAEGYAENNMARVYYVGNPAIPFGKPVPSYFGAVDLPDDDPTADRQAKQKPKGKPPKASDHYIIVNKKVVGPHTRALAKIFEFAAKGTYTIKAFSSYAKRNKAAVSEPGKPKKKTKASNHTLGLALDINPSQNAQGEFVWDMPKEIVEIFLLEGFYWGGLYKTTPDAMHFEFKLPIVPAGGAPSTNVVFPLGPASSGRLESPVAYYHNNESIDTGVGGYYGLGLRRNLHGGIHLFPETGDELAGVNAIAPGYLVAARLPRPGDDPQSRAVMDMLQSWPGFVLLRHDLSMLSPKAAEGAKPQHGHFYSLYMHLAPFDATLAEHEPYFQHVPWFREALKRRYGCWIKVTADGSDPPGTALWAKSPVSPGDKHTSFPVFGRDEEIVVRGADGKPHWLFKAPPSDFAKVIDALSAGKLVTFTEPFFPIATAGEPIGLSQAVPVTTVPYRSGYIAKGKNQRVQVRSGFVHWEVFAPVRGGTSAIRDVLQLARDSFPELASVLADSNEISETTPDNFLDLSEIKQKVLPRLPADHVADLETVIARMEANRDRAVVAPFDYCKELLDLFVKADSFAPATRGDATGKLVNEDFTYPVALQLELENMVSPDQLADGGPYELSVEYFAAPKPVVSKKGRISTPPRGVSLGKQKLVIAADKWNPSDDPLQTGKLLQLTLRVPAAAVTVVFQGLKNVVAADPVKAPPVGTELFKTLAPLRFRSTRITHLTEWAPKAVEKLTEKLKQHHLLPEKLDASLLYSLSWWHKEGFSVLRWLVDKSSWSGDQEALSGAAMSLVTPPQEEALVSITHKGDNSVFGDGPDQLPVDALVDNFHPVTFVWLLALLRAKQLEAAKPAGPGGAAPKPASPGPGPGSPGPAACLVSQGESRAARLGLGSARSGRPSARRLCSLPRDRRRLRLRSERPG